MFPQLSEILTLVELSKLKVLSGEEGLSNEVKFITIMDNPDIVYWMEEQEILLTNGYFLRDLEEEQMILFINDLAAKNISALFIKFKRFIMELPENVLAHANSIGFPIIEVPVELSWTDISEPVNRYLNERQYYFLHQAMSLRDSMLKLLLSGGSMNELCNLCADSLGKELAIYDVKMKLIAKSKTFDTELLMAHYSPLKRRHRYTMPNDELIKYEHYSVEAEEITFFLLPINYDTSTWGYIILETPIFKPVIYADLAKTEQLAALSAVEIAKINELKKIEEKYLTEFVGHVIAGEIKTMEEIILRGEKLGRKIFREYVVCVLEKTEADVLEELLDNTPLKLKQTMLFKDCFFLEKQEYFLFLFPQTKEAPENFQLMYDYLSQNGCLGISRTHQASDMHQAFNEAQFAYSCKELMKDSKVFFEETGILQLFFTENAQLNMHFIRDYHDQLTQPLLDYDEKNGTELFKTLQILINENMSVRQTASALYIHENTLRSRIRRIEAVTGKNLQDMHDVFQLMLGSYVFKFLYIQQENKLK